LKESEYEKSWRFWDMKDWEAQERRMGKRFEGIESRGNEK